MLTLDDTHTLIIVTEAAEPYGVDPRVPIEAETYFTKLLLRYDGPQEDTALSDWLKQQISEQFISITEKPQWIQNPEWQFANGQPMIFAGQIDISRKSFPFYHDDTSLYIFIGRKVPPKVVIQQY
jgi:hypothetical protein